MDKKIQKVINKCHSLIEKGYSFDYCLNKYGDFQQEIKDYFTTVERLSSLRKVQPKKNFRENSLKYIIDKAEKSDKAGRIKSEDPIFSRRRLVLRPVIIFLVFLVLLIFSFAGTIFASQKSTPGETLYPLKRSFEEFRLNIYPENLKDDLHLQFLYIRIDEANILLSDDIAIDSILVEELLAEIDKEYQICKQYGCINSNNKHSIIDSIDTVKKRYQKIFGKNSDKEDQNKSEQNQESLNSNDQRNEEQDSAKKNRGEKNSGRKGKN